LASPKYQVTWKSLLLPLVGLAAFFVYVYIFNVDVQQIYATVQRINLSFYLLATIATLLDTLFFTLAWRSLIRFLSVKVSFLKLTLFVWFGVFIDTIIPAESVSGEISKIYLVNREQSGSAGKATASIVAHRLIGMGINIGILLTGVALLFVENQFYGSSTTTLIPLILLIVGLIFLFLILTVLLCTRERWTLRIVDVVIGLAERISRGRWKLTRWRGEVMDAARSFHDAMREYRRAPKPIAVAAALTISSWVCSLVVFYLTFLSIGYTQINWSAILIISTIFAAVKSVPIGVPFEVGLPEIALSSLLILFNVPLDISFTATILMRLLTLWLKFFIGFVAQQWIGLTTITTTMSVKPNTKQDEEPSHIDSF